MRKLKNLTSFKQELNSLYTICGGIDSESREKTARNNAGEPEEIWPDKPGNE